MVDVGIAEDGAAGLEAEGVGFCVGSGLGGLFVGVVVCHFVVLLRGGESNCSCVAIVVEVKVVECKYCRFFVGDFIIDTSGIRHTFRLSLIPPTVYHYFVPT